jgi:BirA family biotin operon repressor/biotin-[acetyl-CoA-carboxylase] ligase
VLLNGKKVCGILIENQVQGQQYSQAVAGIGLNVNQKNFEWPIASSLSLCAGVDLDKTKLFDILLTKLEIRYEQLRIKSFKSLQDDYYSVLYRKDERHEFSVHDQIFTGMIKGIDEIGRLLVQDSEKLRSFNFKEIIFLNLK